MPLEPWQLQPARDTGLTPPERFRSVRRESGLLESAAQQACFSVLRIYFAIAHRLTITGREKLPAHGPFVLAANHCSHLDALVLRAALRPRHRERAFPIAAGDVFLSNHCSQCVLRNHAQRFAAVAKKLWSACSCRVASQIAARKSDFHNLPGRRTYAHRFNDAFQARTWHACRGNKCSRRALRAYWKL
jgi:Acyltransferase